MRPRAGPAAPSRTHAPQRSPGRWLDVLLVLSGQRRMDRHRRAGTPLRATIDIRVGTAVSQSLRTRTRFSAPYCRRLGTMGSRTLLALGLGARAVDCPTP